MVILEVNSPIDALKPHHIEKGSFSLEGENRQFGVAIGLPVVIVPTKKYTKRKSSYKSQRRPNFSPRRRLSHASKT